MCNILIRSHLVLARLPDAPAGVKGLSLFIVPKYLLDESGEPAARNDIRCISIEHKMGIHGSPTCTLSYGDNGGATSHATTVCGSAEALLAMDTEAL